MYTKTTYFSELRSVLDISSPIIDNNTGMRHKGLFVSDWREENVEFDALYYGLKKRRQDRAVILCDNASNLFSTSSGQIDLVFKLDQNIVDGVLEELEGSTAHLSSFIIWGINIGEYEAVQPTINAKFTKDGIKFELWTSEARFSLTDTVTNVLAGEPIVMRFAWNKNGMDGFDGYPGITAYYNCNGTEIISDVPIATESISGLNFCIGNTPYLNNNLPMTMGRIEIYDGVSLLAEPRLHASSSSSSFSSSSGSSDSSSSYGYSTSSSSIDSSSSSSSSFLG